MGGVDRAPRAANPSWEFHAMNVFLRDGALIAALSLGGGLSLGTVMDAPVVVPEAAEHAPCDASGDEGCVFLSLSEAADRGEARCTSARSDDLLLVAPM